MDGWITRSMTGWMDPWIHIGINGSVETLVSSGTFPFLKYANQCVPDNTA